jgi:hypothetical protein
VVREEIGGEDRRWKWSGEGKLRKKLGGGGVQKKKRDIGQIRDHREGEKEERTS